MRLKTKAALEMSARRSKSVWVAPLVVLLAALAVYTNTLGNGFVWDDHNLILDNPRIDDPTYVRYLFLERQLWRPLTRVSTMADYALWGPERPFGFHLTNLLLHASTCLALYLLFLRLQLDRVWASIIAVLFAIHPVHVEAVASIAHRKEPLALLFYLLAFLAYLRLRDGGTSGAPLSSLLTRSSSADSKIRLRLTQIELLAYTMICYLLAMLAKEAAAVMFPVMVLIYEAVVATDPVGKRLRRLSLFLIPIVCVLGVFLARGYLGSIPRRFSAEQIEWITNSQTNSYSVVLLTSIKAFWAYAKLLIWPSPLYLDRGFDLATSPTDPLVVSGLILLGLAVVALVWSAKRTPLVFFGLSWYLVNLLPVINVVPLTHWLFAERFLYVPSVGFVLMVGLGLKALWAGGVGLPNLRLERGLVLGLLCAVLVTHTVTTMRQNRIWKNSLSLWTHTLRFNPRSYRGLYGLGRALELDGNSMGATVALQRALQVNPSYPDARASLAALLCQQERYDDCLTHARTYTLVEPEDSIGYLLIGEASVGLGELGQAVEAYRKVIELELDHPEGTYNLALLLHNLGHSAKALEVLDDGPTFEADSESERLFQRLLSRVGSETRRRYSP